LSGDPVLIQLIEQGRDLYCEFASKFYKKLITKENKMERKFGKTAILGLDYNMGWVRFQKQVFLDLELKIEDKQAKEAVNLYRKMYINVPKLWRYLDKFIYFLTRSGEPIDFVSLPIRFEYETIVLPSGLKIRYPNLRKDKKDGWIYDIWDKKVGGTVIRNLYGGKILENVCQALAGELCKDIILEHASAVVGFIYDEVILVVPEEEAHAAASKLRCDMMQPPRWLPNIKLDCEIKSGDNWREAK